MTEEKNNGKPKVILFVIPTLTAGGAERVIITLLNHLERTGIKLVLAVVNTQNAVFLDDIPKDIEFIDLQCTRVRYAIPRIWRLIWSINPDVVFSTLGYLNICVLALKPFLPKGLRIIVRETDVVSHSEGVKLWPRLWPWAYRTFYRYSDKVICQSKHMYDDLSQNFSIPADKLTIIHNPVDINKIKYLSSAEGPFHNNTQDSFSIKFVAAGRLVEQKGFDLLIKAVALSGLKHLRVTILGDGPLEKELRHLAYAHGVDNQIIFAGSQKNPFPFFANSDAFILSSRYDAFPNVVLEALACGVPVIATPAPGGIREMANATSGILLASEISANSLCDQFRIFVSNPAPIEYINLTKFKIHRVTSQYKSILIGRALSHSV